MRDRLRYVDYWRQHEASSVSSNPLILTSVRSSWYSDRPPPPAPPPRRPLSWYGGGGGGPSPPRSNSELFTCARLRRPSIRPAQPSPRLEGTQIRPMSPTPSIADLVVVPKEWRRGDDVVRWSKQHEHYNLLWLENLWKWIREHLPSDLSPLENLNLLYVSNSREQYLTLYKLTANSTLLHCPKELLLDPLLSAMQRILLKLDIHVVDNFSELVLRHPDLVGRYVFRFDGAGVLTALRNKLRRRSVDASCCSAFLSNAFNADLTPKEVGVVRTYFARGDFPDSELLLRALPMFVDASSAPPNDKFVSLESASMAYPGGPRLPPAARLTAIYAHDPDSRALVERMGLRVGDFNSVAKHVVAAAAGSLGSADLGKWVIAHCAGLIVSDAATQEALSRARVFQNRKLELVSPRDLVDPTPAAASSVLGPRLLPSLELSVERNLGLLRMLKLRTVADLSAEELVEVCEASRTFPPGRRLAVAGLVAAALAPRCGAGGFIERFPWVPVMQKRPPHYPPLLGWFASSSSASADQKQFVAPTECLPRSAAFVAGSVALIADIDHPVRCLELTPAMVVRHLKNAGSSDPEIARRCHEALQAFDPAEMRICIPAEMDVGPNREMLRSAAMSVVKDARVVVVCVGDDSAASDSCWNHYRLYEQVVLPHLSAFSRNVKDALMLLALDHCDVRMMAILRRTPHPFVPATPNGCVLRHPSALVHPHSALLRGLFDPNTDPAFPYGSRDTYLREDRLEVLRMLGMRWDRISWKEVVERAGSGGGVDPHALLNLIGHKIAVDADGGKEPASAALSTTKFAPVKGTAGTLARPCDLIAPEHEPIAGASFAVIDSDNPAVHRFLRLRQPTVADALHQLASTAHHRHACIKFVHAHADAANASAIREFFARNAVLAAGPDAFCVSGRIFSAVEWSVLPFVVGLDSCNVEQRAFITDVLKVKPRPDLQTAVAAIEAGADAAKLLGLVDPAASPNRVVLVSAAFAQHLSPLIPVVRLSDADAFAELVDTRAMSPAEQAAAIARIDPLPNTVAVWNRRMTACVPAASLFDPAVARIDPDADVPHPDLGPVLARLPLQKAVDPARLRRLMTEVGREAGRRGWTPATRERSRALAELGDVDRDVPFLEPHTFDSKLCALVGRYGLDDGGPTTTVLALNQAVAARFAPLVWSTAFVVNATAAQPPALHLVLKNLTNIADALARHPDLDDVDLLVDALQQAYDYIGGTQLDVDDDWRSKPIVWTDTRQMVPASRVCVGLPAADQIPPFVYALPAAIHPRSRELFVRLGAFEAPPDAAMYANILAQVASVCRHDFLNSNEIQKVLKATRGLFGRLLVTEDAAAAPPHKFTGLFLLGTDLKMHRAADVVIADSRAKLDYVRKLPMDAFLFNPAEQVLKLGSSAAARAVARISPSQRPQLFSEKYQESFSMAIPEDRDGKRQQILHAVERKYTQLLQSRTLHRAMGRALSDGLGRSKARVCVAVDQMELYLRTRLALIRVVCVEHLETSLVLNAAAAAKQRIDTTVEEQAVYLATDQPDAAFTLYLSLRHAEQPYLPSCLARALVPLLEEVKQAVDTFVLATLLASSISHMPRALDLVGITPEDAILPNLKLNYVPSAGRLYGDEVSLLCNYDPAIHRLIPGDLCVYRKRTPAADFVLVYCTFVRARRMEVGLVSSCCSGDGDEYDNTTPEVVVEFVELADFFVLENWTRVQDAAHAQPLDDTAHERRSSSSESTSSPSFTDEERAELDATKTVLDGELREAFFALKTADDRKRRVKRLLLKWHPDKNQGREKFASEVFKYLRTQIDLFEDVEQPAWSPADKRFGGSFDNLNKEAPAATPKDETTTHRTHSGSASPPGRSSSFRTAREEWQWKRTHGFSRRTGLTGEETAPSYHAEADAQRWLRQAISDLASATNDMVCAEPAFEWACYKCYRAAEKGLKALHLTKSAGTIPASDLPTLLFGVQDDVRLSGYTLYRWIGDANRMQYPNLARAAKIPHEAFTSTHAERALECTRDLLNKIEAVVRINNGGAAATAGGHLHQTTTKNETTQPTRS